MVNNDMISQVTELMRRGNLDKMRACYIEYSTDFDGRAYCREYETKIKNAQKKAKNLAWTDEIYALRDTKLSVAATKYYTLKNVLDDMVKEADSIVAADRSARQAKAKSIDDEYNSFSGLLSNERIADARIFVKNYHATSQSILSFCQKATGAEIKKFEARLDKNFKDNGLRAQAAELDKKFATISTAKRDRSYFTAADMVIAQIKMASADVRVFCNIATGMAIDKLVREINTQKSYHDYEDRIDNLAATKARTMAWCEKVWSEYKVLSPYINEYRNAQKLRDLNNEANAMHTEFLAKAKAIDTEYDRFTGILNNDGIAKARIFAKNYYATPNFITALCKKATATEIKKFEARLDKNFKDNGLRAQASELDKKFVSLSPVKRDKAYFTMAEATIAQIKMASSDVRVYCVNATDIAIDKLVNSINIEKKYLACEEQIDALALSKTRAIAWCQRAWNEYNSLYADISKYRNAQKLRDLNNEATKMYTEIICDPYVKALDARSSFKTVLELEEGLKTFDKKDILQKGIVSFDDKWKKRVADAWTEARKQAHEYFIQGKSNYDKKQYDKSLALFLDADKYGNKECHCHIGLQYYYGYGVAQNQNKAIYYFKIAGNNGDLTAMNYLGDIYDTSSPAEAFAWRKRSVDGGGVYSRLALAKMYYDGRGTAKNTTEARKLFEKLAKEDNPEANAYMGRYYEFEAAISRDKKTYDRALECYRKGSSIAWAKKEYDELFHKLDEERRDNEIEEQLALAKKGYPDAQRYIGECYYRGYRTQRSYEMAREWFEKAAKQGNGKAMSLLGDMYANGQGVKQDLKKAKKYYQDAIKHGEK